MVLSKRIRLVALLAAASLSGCTVKQMALETTADILADASVEIETETSWQRFRDSTPAALKVLEGLLYVDPENEALRVSVIKGYSAYGYGVYETLHLNEKYQDPDHKPYLSLANESYSRAVRHAMAWLSQRGIALETLQAAGQGGEAVAYMERFLDSDNDLDIEGAFFAGQSWLSYINLNRNNPALVSQVFMTKPLFDWVCAARPDYRFGSCDIFYASYAASRPKMLGGNPAKGRELFLKAMQRYPDNLLLRVAYLEYSVIPAMDEEAYKAQKTFLQAQQQKLENTPYIPGSPSTATEATKASARQNIFNAIALKRFQIIINNEKEIF